MLSKIDHLGIAVRSIEERLGFWRDGLLLGEPHREEVASERVRVAMLQIGESRVELLEPNSDSSVVAQFIARRGEGLHHVCFAVGDIDSAIAELRAHGHALVGEAPRIGAGGCRVAFIHPRSSGGVLIELKEEPASARRADAGEVVVVCLRDPTEKYWGRIQELSSVGVHLRGLELAMVESWAREVAGAEPPTLGVATMFFPLARVERIYVDEDIGPARSERTAFRDVVGRDVMEFL